MEEEIIAFVTIIAIAFTHAILIMLIIEDE